MPRRRSQHGGFHWVHFGHCRLVYGAGGGRIYRYDRERSALLPRKAVTRQEVSLRRQRELQLQRVPIHAAEHSREAARFSRHPGTSDRTPGRHHAARACADRAHAGLEVSRLALIRLLSDDIEVPRLTHLIQLGSPEISGAPQSGLLLDSFGPLHSDLRISVTDRCNIRCFYCMPEEGAEFVPRLSLLSFEEIERFVQAALPLGITKIRLTGGEPLLRPRLYELIARLSERTVLRDLALTTNGVLLGANAQTLFDAGLRRLNVHLDTLDRERFRTITRRDDLRRVLAGIE